MSARPIGKGIRLEIQSLGLNAFVPIITMLLWLVYTSFGQWTGLTQSSWYPIGNILSPLQTAIAPLAAWWPIFLLQRMLEAPGGEIFFTYPAKRLYLGLVRVAISYIFYAALLALTIWLIQSSAPESFFKELLSMGLVQGFLFAGIGFMAMTLTGNTFFAIAAVAAYAVALVSGGYELRNFGHLLFAENKFQLLDHLPDMEQIKQLSVRVLPLAALAWGAATAVFASVKPRK